MLVSYAPHFIIISYVHLLTVIALNLNSFELICHLHGLTLNVGSNAVPTRSHVDEGSIKLFHTRFPIGAELIWLILYG